MPKWLKKPSANNSSCRITKGLSQNFFQFISLIHHRFFSQCASPSQVNIDICPQNKYFVNYKLSIEVSVSTAWSASHQVALVRETTRKWEPLGITQSSCLEMVQYLVQLLSNGATGIILLQSSWKILKTWLVGLCLIANICYLNFSSLNLG